MTIQSIFKHGMKRDIITPLEDWDPFTHKVVNIGAGNSKIPGTISLDRPEWDAECGVLPFDDESFYQVHMYHFLDQIKNPIEILRECERILVTGGHINIVVPYYSSQLRCIGVNGYSPFCEESWKNFFTNHYYNRNDKPWRLTIGTNLIIGLVERNICLLTQLIKKY